MIFATSLSVSGALAEALGGADGTAEALGPTEPDAHAHGQSAGDDPRGAGALALPHAAAPIATTSTSVRIISPVGRPTPPANQNGTAATKYTLSIPPLASPIAWPTRNVMPTMYPSVTSNHSSFPTPVLNFAVDALSNALP